MKIKISTSLCLYVYVRMNHVYVFFLVARTFNTARRFSRFYEVLAVVIYTAMHSRFKLDIYFY